MQPLSTAFAAPTPAQPGVPGMPAGAARMSTRYYDETGRMRTSRTPVPVDQYGVLAGVEYSCRRCHVSGWFPVGLRGIPTCDGCDRRMEPGAVKAAPLLPWRDLWDVCERPLRPVWSLPALAAAGWAVDAAPIPALVLASAAPSVGELARRVAERQLIRAKVARGRLEEDDPEGGKRLRAAIARQARTVGYTSAAAMGWLALAAGLGMDPHTLGGKISLATLGLMWVWPAATWWRKIRAERNRPAPTVEEPTPAEPDKPGLAELITKRWAETVGAQGGKLPGTVLENVHRVTGGWAATIVDPLMRGLDYTGAGGGANPRRNIAAVFGVGVAAVSLEPDVEDANRCFVMVQPKSPLKEVVRWDGPQSVDAERGTGMAGRYADGTTMFYEVYRPGWGCPHDALFGTTGSGKSEMFCQLMTIDRWMHYVDRQGRAHGVVADFLIDPQHGQSFGPFLDDLAAPVATDIEQAMLLVAALEREGLRRNEYLARVEWVDDKGRPRKGRKFWDPFVDGPLLVVNVDEAHFFLAFKMFTERISAAARMWRKVGMKVRIGTHTPLLSDLGGSMALRDMLTGGFVWVGRTANSLSGPTAFNGQLPVDPRSIPKVPGMAYAIAGANPRALLMRSAWEPDYYDWVRDANNQPIGYPAVLPSETLRAMGPEFVTWRDSGKVDSGQPAAAPKRSRQDDPRSADVVLSVLADAKEPLDTNELDAAVRRMGHDFKVRTLRDALQRLRESGRVATGADGRHGLTAQAREEMDALVAERVSEVEA